MTDRAASQARSSTLPHHPAANGTTQSPPAPQAAWRGQAQAWISDMRTALIWGLAALMVMMIFIIQNVHTANVSFLGVHLVLPLAGALFLAAIAGSLLTVAGGPARIAQLRQIIRRGLREASAGSVAPVDRSSQSRGMRRHDAESTVGLLPLCSARHHRPPPTRARH